MESFLAEKPSMLKIIINLISRIAYQFYWVTDYVQLMAKYHVTTSVDR